MHFENIRKINIKTEVNNLNNGYTENVGAAIINLSLTGHLCNLRNK